ncbi:trypsin Inhibitor like cysteine rich domain protein [Necator americanus]|uniref:Trypsin Inhibitor like cysteine rich domain protein n=1 Tax=Necator americanus TaxID=51031 RepID=W2SPX6_NECAM|nr:trypsin Inhibitor like cysteine rich domain protein [Necator americanus]ETN70916.1 trypsin Inhibitor like cysteine rich domain protein [Necator americanus]
MCIKYAANKCLGRTMNTNSLTFLNVILALVFVLECVGAGEPNPCIGYQCKKNQRCISNYGRPQCIALDLNCTKDEVVGDCGNVCEPTCADANGQKRECPALCGPPACVCKPNTYRYNGTCVSAKVCKQNGTDDNGGVTPCSRFPCPSGYQCSEGAVICTSDGCVTRPTQCVPESCPDILGCNNVTCPRNMERVTCYPLCELDCAGGDSCPGTQCNSLGRCVCKKGYVLVFRENRRLGCVKKNDCACTYDSN